MLQLIIIAVLFVIIGFLIYKLKKKPVIGIKRNKFIEYLEDYLNIKIYYASFALMFMGFIILLTIIILELFF